MKRVLVPIVILGSCIAFSYALIRTPLSLDEVACLLYTSPSPRDATLSRMPSSA